MSGEFTYFPGIDGVPFRTRNTTAPDIKWSDPETKRPVFATDMHADVFDLSSEDDRKKLETILTKCAKGVAYESSRSQVFDEAHSTFRVLLIWGEHFYEDPQEARDGTREYK
jgi:hypothetical protein